MDLLGWQLVQPLINKLLVRNHKLTISCHVHVDDERLADIQHADQRHMAYLRLYENFFQQSDYEMLSTIVHELLHVHFHPIRELIDDFLDDELSQNNKVKFVSLYSRREEYIVDDVAVIVTNAIPEEEKKHAYALFEDMRQWYKEATSKSESCSEDTELETADVNEYSIISGIKEESESEEENSEETVDSEEEISDNDSNDTVSFSGIGVQ
jgi:hypothetical protein